MAVGELQPRIIVLGVGGAGGNAVNNMIEAELKGVEFVVANTDSQALAHSKAQHRIQLGPQTTEGLGAGARPEIGADAAEESLDDIRAVLEGAHMVFIAAGMGGGTGTGAAPVIARKARELGVLTVAVLTKPFGFEGARRMELAEEGLVEIRKHVDTMIVVPNQNLFRVANEQTTFADAFRLADDVLYCGVRGVTDLMVMPGLINLDFADVRNVMHGMGAAMMGMAEARGDTRARDAAQAAIDNPLLDDVTMRGARAVLINITGGYDMTLYEVDEAANKIRAEVDPNANIFLGSTFDPGMDGAIRVSVVACGLEEAEAVAAVPVVEPEAADLDAPVVVTGMTAANEIESRPDFEGRPIPEARLAAEEGDDEVASEGVFSDGAPPVENARLPEPVDEPDGAGFSNLFGWRRSTSEGEGKPADGGAEAIVSSPNDHPEPAPFDDADLEIPAFLRRSANH